MAMTRYGRERDSQRGKLYRAEQGFWNGNAIGNRGFDSVEEMQEFVDRVLRKRAVKNRFGEALCKESLRVEAGRGGGAYAYGGYLITVSRSSRKEWVLLHELAHILRSRLEQKENWLSSDADPAAHGWEFADVYCWLVWIVLGAEAGRGLKAAFRQGKVKYKAPRKGRKMSPEEREAAVARLTAGRKAKPKSEEAVEEPKTKAAVKRGCKACDWPDQFREHTCGLRSLQSLLTF